MPYFSKSSKVKLDTCDPRLMELFYTVIDSWDCKIAAGHRTADQQFKEYKKGRKEINGIWQIVDKDKVTTYLDGYIKSSDHQTYPSKAVDVWPLPLDWNNIIMWKEFASYVKGVAAFLKIPVLHGGDWIKPKDYPHWYLK